MSDQPRLPQAGPWSIRGLGLAALTVLATLAASTAPMPRSLSAAQPDDGPPPILRADSSFGTQDEDDGGYVEDRLLVGFRGDTPDEEKAALHARFGAQVIRQLPELDVQVLRFNTGADTLALVTAYQSQQGVAFAEPDYLAMIQGWPDPISPPLGNGADRPQPPDDSFGLLDLMLTPNDPYYSRQWHHAKIGSAQAWDVSRGVGVTIAIIDTGVNCSHQDLNGRCVAGYDFVNDDANPADDNGHGTHVAGIAAAATNNGIGIAATGFDARIMPMKALNRTGNGSHSSIANSITWAVDRGADVVNMSLGGFFTSSTLRRAVEYAIGEGVVVLAAAGNENTSNPSYPAAYDGVIGVAATTQSDQRASFSNFGTYVDVAAPGVGILSTVSSGSYQAWSGTSMACPVAAGVAALLVAQNPNRTPAQIETIMEQSAEDLGDRGWDPLFGWGRIHAGRAVQQAPGTTTPPTPAPDGGATPVPAASPTPSSDFTLQVEELINIERSLVGLHLLHTSPALRQASLRHATDMATNTFCTHDGSDGSTAYERMRDAGYTDPFSEIIGCGQDSPTTVVSAWMNSPAHRAIILCNVCTELGAGHFLNGSPFSARNYWTVTFGTRPTTGPAPTPALPATAVPGPTVGPTATNAPPTPTPVTPPDMIEVVLMPENNRVGWVVSSQPSLNHFDDEDTYTGTWNGRTYHGAAQFDLDLIPREATIAAARLELTGRSREFLGSVGTWSVNMLRTEIDGNFANEGYSGIHNAAIDATLLPLLGTNDLDEGMVNTFVFDSSQVDLLAARRLGSARLSVRTDGPTSGSFSNLFTWDTGHGDDTLYPGPRLVVLYRLGVAPPPSATATPLPVATDTPPPPTAGPTATSAPATATSLPPTATATAPPPPPTPVPTRTLPPPPPTQLPSDTPFEIVPLREDVGYVRQYEAFNHFGDDNTFTGYYQTRGYHGGMQFQLDAIPTGTEIRWARLTLTGQNTRYLSSIGNGLWDVKMLTAAEDAGWRSSNFASLHSARISSSLVPELRQADFGIGRENSFVLQGLQLRELEFRAATTGRVSFRIDGPSGGVSNIMDWDSGYGPGRRTPPKLEIVVGPPGSAEPVPTKSPEDQARITELINDINRTRLENGGLPLEVSTRLSQASALHNEDMVRNRFFSHTGSDGSDPMMRVTRAGFDAIMVEEMLAAANGDPSTVVEAWMNQGQRDVLLNPDLTHIGAHYLFSTGSPYQHYWTVKLARANRP